MGVMIELSGSRQRAEICVLALWAFQSEENLPVVSDARKLWQGNQTALKPEETSFAYLWAILQQNPLQKKAQWNYFSSIKNKCFHQAVGGLKWLIHLNYYSRMEIYLKRKKIQSWDAVLHVVNL